MPRSVVGDMMKAKTFDVFYENVVKNIKLKALECGFNQTDIARCLFVSQPIVSIKFKGIKSRFSIEDLFKLSLLFKCSVEDLITKKE